MRCSSSACLALRASTCSVMDISTLRSVTETLHSGMLTPPAKPVNESLFHSPRSPPLRACHVLQKPHYCRHQRGLRRDLWRALSGGPQGASGRDSPGDVQGGGNDFGL